MARPRKSKYVDCDRNCDSCPYPDCMASDKVCESLVWGECKELNKQLRRMAKADPIPAWYMKGSFIPQSGTPAFSGDSILLR